MAALELILLLFAVSAVLRLVAERLMVPYAAILVVGGLLLAFVPGLPRVTLPPDVLFLVFIPPLLYAGSINFPLREIRREIGPIIRLSVVMVLVSTAAVAVVAHGLHPAFTWAAAITLGAIVAPPDPVAVLSIMRSLRIPRELISILEGEGLLNDATALVTYRLAIVAAVTGVFSPSQAAVQFLAGGAGGIAIGLLIGVVVSRVHRVTRSVPVVSDTVSLLTPFASYLLADLVGASGILSVVAWVMPSAYIFRWFFRWLRHGHEPMPSWRSILFIAWTGLRGADSLVLALSLPLQTASGARFPARDQIIFITFCVIFITLVVQGPTVAPFARLLGIRANDEEVAEEAHARLAAAEAGLRTLDEPVISSSQYPEVVRYLRQRHRQRARRWAAREQEPHDAESEDVAHDHDHFTIAPSHEAAAIDDRRGEEYRRVRSAMLHAETEAILDLRDRGVIDDDVMRRIQRDFDLETLLLETSEPVIETVSEVPSAIDAAAR